MKRLTLLLLVVLIIGAVLGCGSSGKSMPTTIPTPTLMQSPTLLLTPVPIPTPTLTPAPMPTVTATPQPSTDLSYLINSDPAKVDNSAFPITPVDQLHVDYTHNPTRTFPEVNIGDYRLTVDGLVEKPLTLTYDAVLAYPSVTEVVLLICPGSFVDNAQWTGVPVSTLLTEAGIKAGATKVSFQALDGYQDSLPLEVVQQEGVFLAYKVDGQVLPAAHGYPLRLVVKGEYGNNWVRWVTHIEVM